MNEKTQERLTRAKAALRGAICGDILGSHYEWHPTKDYDFALLPPHSRMTDDTVCSIAVADAFFTGKPMDESLQEWCRKYPRAGYGGKFKRWVFSDDPRPYGSFGNGSAMRVSPAGALADSVEGCLELAERTAEPTHNHPEGIKGAQAVALAIYLALEGKTKEEIKDEIDSRFGYNLSRDYGAIQTNYYFDSTCMGSVPEAIICFLISDDYESAVRRAIALGGDSDTQAAIAGGIAAAYYGEIPEGILARCMKKLPEEMQSVIGNFDKLLEECHGE